MPSFRIRIKKNDQYIVNKVYNSFPNMTLALKWAEAMKATYGADHSSVSQVLSPSPKPSKK